MQTYKNYDGDYSYSVQEFGGINERLRIGENEFASMENMSLDEYPVLTVRDKRVIVDGNTPERKLLCLRYQGKYIKITREWHYGYEVRLYIDDTYSGVLLSDEEEKRDKQIYGMGNYIIIVPDFKYVNISKPSENGELDISSSDWLRLTLTPCTLSGDAYKIKATGNTAPSNPTNGDIWVDTSGASTVLKTWDESTKMWQSVAATYIRISVENSDVDFTKLFKDWDVVGICSLLNTDSAAQLRSTDEKEFDSSVKEKLINQLKTFISTKFELTGVNGLSVEQKAILYKVEEKSVIVSGIIDSACKLNALFYKGFPALSYMFEHNNRMWGCRSYTTFLTGKHINEIIASKQGDFTNWFSYLGVSTDSYAVTVGVPGAFTGGVSFGGCPLFFKEDCIIKVYGSMPSNYQIITTPCMGVEKGMAGSIVIANGVLFYKSPSCFCAYDGSMPVNISSKLKNKKYKDIQAGSTDNKVYFACTEESGEKYILVFDIERGTWTKENCDNIKYFVRNGNVLNFVECDSDGAITALKSINSDYDSSIIYDEEAYPILEEDFEWHFESGDIGLDNVNLKYIKNLQIRAKIYAGSSFRAFVSCDGEEFLQAGNKILTPGIKTVSIPVSLERCESFRYRLEGRGRVDIYSINYEIKEGSGKS